MLRKRQVRRLQAQRGMPAGLQPALLQKGGEQVPRRLRKALLQEDLMGDSRG